ncbi:MAG TPA: DUF4124 domain-containing protein [Gammaproteobacteria bacterium]|nr:DUF4124 domain-containing protein [Gammaproteobacteria bacterium]
MIRFLLPVLVIALASMAATAQEVYRTVNPDGTVVYSDRPLSERSQLVSVAIRPTDPERAAAEADALLEAEEERDQRSAAPAGLAEARAEQAEKMAEACRIAQQKAEAYERAPRIYEEMPDGSRRYLSDEDVVRERLAARQAVTDYCPEE